MLFKSFALLGLAAAPALANVFITSPTASSTFNGGQQAQIQWQDDGKAPTLKDMGNCKVSIYVGNALQQTSVQTIVDSVDVSTTSTIQFTPDAGAGPNSNEYFIRVESLTAKDSGNPQYPALSFSAKFTLAGMTGSFSPAVEAQIAGQSTAPLAGPTAAAGGPTGGAPAASSPAPTGGASASSNHAATSASSSAPSSKTSSANSALNFKAGWSGIVLSTLAFVVAL
jgi:hypothetical protein